MQRIWVQLCGKNRHKVIILFMHKRKRGKWVFIDMIKRGAACLADEVSITVYSTKGVAFDSSCTSIEQTKQSRYRFNAMLKHMINILVVMFTVTMCWKFHLKEANCKVNCKCTSN